MSEVHVRAECKECDLLTTTIPAVPKSNCSLLLRCRKCGRVLVATTKGGDLTAYSAAAVLEIRYKLESGEHIILTSRYDGAVVVCRDTVARADASDPFRRAVDAMEALLVKMLRMRMHIATERMGRAIEASLEAVANNT